VKKKKTKAKKKSYHHRTHEVTEKELVGGLNEDLQDAWEKLRDFGASLGEQRIYASHNSIMFSKKVCYFFARPKKSFIEVWIFLPREVKGLKSMRSAKKIEKYCNLFKLIHPDQVEEPLTDYLREAYDFIPA
jgi:hypothetical protein